MEFSVFFLFPISAEQFQRSNPLSASRIEMNVGLGNTANINISKLKREVEVLRQRQQEIQLFNQVRRHIHTICKLNLN